MNSSQLNPTDSKKKNLTPFFAFLKEKPDPFFAFSYSKKKNLTPFLHFDPFFAFSFLHFFDPFFAFFAPTPFLHPR